MKVLVRNNSSDKNECEVLSDSEFMSTALDQIANLTKEIKVLNEHDKVLNNFADIFDLMHSYMFKAGINFNDVLAKHDEFKSTIGIFSDKLAKNIKE